MLLDRAVEVDVTNLPPESAFPCEGGKHHGILRQPFGDRLCRREINQTTCVHPDHILSMWRI